MPQDDSFHDLMSRLRTGEDAAAAEVFQRYAQRLIALARTRLDSQMRRKVDPEDVMQSVFRSFFMRHADGQFELQNWQSLWGMLTVMTIRRCSERIKHFHAARRNVNREVTAPVSDESRSDWQPSDLEPTPAESAALTEIVQDVVHDLEPDDRPILVLHLQGRSVAEISQEINRTRRAVQRVLQRLRLRLERMCLADMDSV